jgi:(1->4)-alpha-D-glucan 1-alpha-D-glucosylmutase
MPERAPSSTYRFQLGPVQGFGVLSDLVDYLADLGVSHLYLSPILTARQGSTHGYDVADPERVAAVLGGEEGLRQLAERARGRGLGLVVDIVPNHVGTGADNPLWERLLAEGQGGGAARFFDVDWNPALPGASGKVLIPVLGKQYGAVLYGGELEVVESGGTHRLRYHDHTFPLSPESREPIGRSTPLEAFVGTPGEPETWQRLHALLEAQHYRLVHWRAGHALINYRRFFAIDELAAVRVEDPQVFDATHAVIVRLVQDGVIDGLRVDHPDGLRDPARYFRRLAEQTGGAWTVAEKITEPEEELPEWSVAGTTGYEFGNDVLGLFVDPAALDTLQQLHLDFGGDARPYHLQAAAAKREILDADLAADARRVAGRLWALAQAHPEVRDVDELACREVVCRTIQALDVYRTYVDPETAEAQDQDRARITQALGHARELGHVGWSAGAPGRDLAPAELYDFLGDVLSGRAGSSAQHLEVIARFQQLSGAVMAKGVEDTVFYRYNLLAAVNEVGGAPDRLGLDVAAFHERNLERMRRHPSGMLTTATHDTKRGEDVRVRMAAISELAEDWDRAVRHWRELNRPHLGRGARGAAPDPATEYLLYQTLVGVWPLDGQVTDELANRLLAYLVKAAREAGVQTTWTDPDESFEDALGRFVRAILDPASSQAFLDSVAAFAGRAAEIGLVSSLAQVLLRTTAPGVPDLYQGNELWDDSLVDPDNRRPVDFAARRRALAELGDDPDVAALVRERRDGRLKLWVLTRALHARRDHAGCFGADGEYVPLPVDGPCADRAVAYARVAPDGKDAVLVVAPRLTAAIGGDRRPPLGEDWTGTTIRLSEQLQGRVWTSLLDPEAAPVAAPALEVGDLLAQVPVALLVGRA